jgi:DNA-damage-inducible protein J
MASTKIAVRTDSQVKQQAQEVFQNLGMDMSTAVNLFLKQSIVEQRLPFQPSLHDMNNIQARYEAEHHIGKEFTNVEDLIRELHSDD